MSPRYKRGLDEVQLLIVPEGGRVNGLIISELIVKLKRIYNKTI